MFLNVLMLESVIDCEELFVKMTFPKFSTVFSIIFIYLFIFSLSVYYYLLFIIFYCYL